MTVTVYTAPGCMPCKATFRKLDRLGIDYTPVDVSTDAEALAYCRSLGHQATPVVVAGDKHWSGYRPDLLDALAK